MNGRKVVILGGGSGGLAAANRLKELLGDRAAITVIDKESKFSMGLDLLWMMVGAKEEDQIAVPRDKIRDKGIEFVNEKVQSIDVQNAIVRTASGGDYPCDYLIIALGAELAPDKISGFGSAFHMYTLEDAKKLRDALSSFGGGRVRIVVSSTPFKCPAAPYEAAMLIDNLLQLKGVRDESDIHVFTPEPLPMPVAGPETWANYWTKRLVA